MLDAAEWGWLERQLTGGFDHLLIATSLPLLLAPGLHYLEAWNEAVCAGAWGQRCASIGEHLRQRLDLEHWAAFESSFTRLVELIRAVGAGELGSPPASIGVLSGDVHHGYLAEAAFAKRAGGRSERRLSSGVLSVPPPARASRADGGARRHVALGNGDHPGAGTRRRSQSARPELEVGPSDVR
jgi:hypothetical protein